MAPEPVPTSSDADRRRADRAGGRREPADHLLLGQLDETLRLRARDERPGVDRERQSVELLEPPDVRDGLTGRPPGDGLAIGRLCIGAHRRVGVGDDRGPVDADGVRQEQLGVEPRRFRAARRQSVDPLPQQLPDLGHGRGAAIRAGW